MVYQKVAKYLQIEQDILKAIKNEEVELATTLLRNHLVATSQTIPTERISPTDKPKQK